MGRVDGEAFGRWSLRLDAAYCVLLGTVLTFGAPALTSAVALPTPVVRVAGIAVVAWAGIVLALLSRLRLRVALRLVMVANILAALAVAAVSTAAATTLVVLAVAATAVDVALFAASQAVALRSLPPATPG